MIWLIPSVLAATSTGAIQIRMAEEIAMAHRLIAAIQQKADYQDADFLKPLGPRDKVFLSAYSRCKAQHVDHTMIMTKQPSVFMRMPGTVAIGWRCKGASPDLPVDLSINFKKGKIAKIETHQQ